MSETNIERVRSFIAIDFPSDLLQRISQVGFQLDQIIRSRQDHTQGKRSDIRWVKKENIHLTLKFLGDVPSSQIEKIQQGIIDCTEKRDTFDLHVRGMGAFPRPAHPNVIWAGIEESHDLLQLQKDIESRMAVCGFPPEERPFRAHLTLGRVARNLAPQEERTIADALTELLSSAEQTMFGSAHIDEVHYYRSDLEREGPRYTRLFSAALQKGR